MIAEEQFKHFARRSTLGLIYIGMVLSLSSRTIAAEWTIFTQIAPTSTTIVSLADADTVYAMTLGTSSGGRIFVYDRSGWSFQTALFGAEIGELRGIYALDPIHVWALGNAASSLHGRLFFFDGSAWKRQPGYTDSGYNNTIYAANDSQVWAGSSLYINYSNDGGASWDDQTFTGASINAINGLNAENVWAVGGFNPAKIYFYDGDSWSVETEIYLKPDGSGTLRSVSPVSENEVWAAGDPGIILHYDGQWSVSTVIGSGSDFALVSAGGPGQAWAGVRGEHSGIYRYDGSRWERSLWTQSIWGIDASIPGRVWASSRGRIYYLPLSSESKYHTDFNGDGTSDIAIFRPAGGLWAVRGQTRLYFGGSTDQPVPADYQGDGITNIAIFRRSSGLWAIRDLTRIYFGNNADRAVPGDYDGEGTADLGIFRESSGLWAVRGITRFYFGGIGDVAAPGYYDGDGTLDPAVFRNSGGLWAIRGISRIYFGRVADTEAPGDYVGGGQWIPAVFRPATGLWGVRGLTRVYFGASVDTPQPADYDGDGRDDIGIFRPRSGLWGVRGITRVYFGRSGDNALTR